MWFYVVLRKGGISIAAWLLFLLGYHHTTYYLTILVLFYVIYWKIRNHGVIWMLNAVLIISILETGWNVGIFHQLNMILDSYYLNPFNWMLFFGIGLLMYRDPQKAIQSFKGWWGILCICGSAVYFSVHLYLGLEFYYFSKYALIGDLLSLGTVVYLGRKLMNGKKKEVLLKIGDWSFSIYLLHQFVAGIVVAITNRWDFFVLTLCRPWIILAITACIVMVIDRIFREKLSWVRTIIGIR
ncbi:MAG: acyltransferase family protein [Waltera sp.]